MTLNKNPGASMKSIYSCQLKHDAQGRIIEKIETVN